METYAKEFKDRFSQLRGDHKPLFNTLDIIGYEFRSLIIFEDCQMDYAIYHFFDGSKCKREFFDLQLL